MTKPLEYHFAGCRLNVATRELWLRDEPQRVEPRVLDFLVYLVERRDRVVRKDELFAHVWDGEMLTDSVLGRAASKARKAIGDCGDYPMLLRTVHRVGYRFVGDVRTVEVCGSSEPAAAPAPETVLSGQTPSPSPSPLPLPLLAPAPAVRSRGPVLRPPPAMEEALGFFALNEEVAAWTAALPALRGAARLDMLVRLAWHLRQRDTRQALQLADEAALLLLVGPQDASAQSANARLMLVRGEARWLDGHLHAANDFATQAAAVFEACADEAGLCDATLLRAAIAVDRDETAAIEAAVRSAVVRAEALGDNERHALLQLQLALGETLRAPADAFARWSASVEGWRAAGGPGVRALCHDVQANWAQSGADRVRRLQHAMAARELFAAVGQRRDVIRQTGNVGELFGNLFDREAALDCLDTALTEARAAGWPLTQAAALAQSAAVIGAMPGRAADAIRLLDEARWLLAPFPAHRVSLMTLRHRGELLLTLDRHDEALAAFELAVTQSGQRGLRSFEVKGLIGLAEACSRLGRPLEARDAALRALALVDGRENGCCGFLVLEAVARIFGKHPDLPHEAVPEASVALHYLLRALAKEARDSRGTSPPSLLDALAAEYARLGDHANAYAFAVRARMALAAAQSDEASSRAIAMKIRHDVAQAEADSQHHRALAIAHAERAAALAQTNAVLERLGTMGQEIARHLRTEDVFAALDRHVHALLDASSLAVFLLDACGTTLELAFGVAGGMPVPAMRVALDDPSVPVARCVRENCELHLECMEAGPPLMPGMMPPQSALLIPLAVGMRVLGALTVQSFCPHAYGERERLVLRSLSAYSAVALNNAEICRRLVCARDARAATSAEAPGAGRRLQPVRREGA